MSTLFPLEATMPDDAPQDTKPMALAEVITHELATAEGKTTATSLQVAEHFGKLHKDVLRAIRNLECSPEFNGRNFAPVDYADEKGELRPMYRITRDGFAFLAMGFTGKEAARWKEAYIDAFNAMEAKLRALYIEPLLDPHAKQFRKGISLRDKLTLQEQGQRALKKLLKESDPGERRNLYWQLLQVNDSLGIPTDSMEALGVQPPTLKDWAERIET